MPKILVINSGSSSFKYQVIDPTERVVYASGLVEKIGNGNSQGTIHHRPTASNSTDAVRYHKPIPDYRTGFEEMLHAFETYGPALDVADITAVGHRVVHGGPRYSGPTLIDETVKEEIEQLSILAPLHNPPALECIQVAEELFTTQPHVAIFDTAFHQTIDEAHYRYAIPASYETEHGIRRYGFHGTSHEYVAKRAAKLLNKSVEDVNLLTLHLGNGASITAIENGKSVNTSMGMTPLEGLVMGTRSGDIDPGIIYFMNQNMQMSLPEINHLLNKESGLFGMAGSNDMRDVQKRAAEGNPDAQLALEMYYNRIVHYIGGYWIQLGHIDGIVFTAGVGENSVETRAAIIEKLASFGVKLDPIQNQKSVHEERAISAPTSDVPVFVIPTNEELEIAKQTYQLVSS